jgi:hypothetical protein
VIRLLYCQSEPVMSCYNIPEIQLKMTFSHNIIFFTYFPETEPFDRRQPNLHIDFVGFNQARIFNGVQSTPNKPLQNSTKIAHFLLQYMQVCILKKKNYHTDTCILGFPLPNRDFQCGPRG